MELYWAASWLNEKPRMLLELFVLYGGIIHVLLHRVVKKDDWRIWFWPTHVCLPTAILTLLARLPDRLDWLGLGYAPLLFDYNLVNWRSLQELFFSLFLFVYLLSIWYRVRPARPDKVNPVAAEPGAWRVAERSGRLLVDVGREGPRSIMGTRSMPWQLCQHLPHPRLSVQRA